MSPSSEVRDAILVQSLRDIADGRMPALYDRFVMYSVAYVRAYVMARHASRRFGFDESFSDVAAGVADMAVGKLLREERGAKGVVGWPVLQQGLARIVGPSADRDASIDDPKLLASYRKLLRRTADRELIHLWMDLHPQEGRLLRAIKRLVRVDPEISIVWDSRGQWLRGPRSDRRRPPIPSDILDDVVRYGSPSPASILRRIRPHLAACEEHGGTCYLLDLVRHAARIGVGATESDPEGTGACPAEMRPAILPSGVPLSVFADFMRNDVRSLALRILGADEAKRKRREEAAADPSLPTRTPRPGAHDGNARRPKPFTNEAVRAWVEICVEMVLRPYGLGRPDWTGCSQHEMLCGLIGEECRGDGAFHMETTNYLIRRVRARWKPPLT